MISLLSILESDLVNGIANGAQLVDLGLNLTQVSNDELMKELERQNKKYLEVIVHQNEIIIGQNEELLKLYNKSDTSGGDSNA